jgi:hypothetical protein
MGLDGFGNECTYGFEESTVVITKNTAPSFELNRLTIQRLATTR